MRHTSLLRRAKQLIGELRLRSCTKTIFRGNHHILSDMKTYACDSYDPTTDMFFMNTS